tara:strand:- start:28 stop:492 length:465 start_codon:yes stop_codon:yes gene_type:complete
MKKAKTTLGDYFCNIFIAPIGFIFVVWMLVMPMITIGAGVLAVGASIYYIGESIYESIPAVKEQRREEYEAKTRAKWEERKEREAKQKWHKGGHDMDVCHLAQWHQGADCAVSIFSKKGRQIEAKRKEALKEAQEEALRDARQRREASKRAHTS